MTSPATVARLVIALLVLAALISDALAALHEGLFAQNISYFTNQSNLMFVVVVVAGTALARSRPLWFDDVRGAVAFYLAMTGIIYALLVAPLDELLRWDIGWTGIVLHRLAPVVAIADWLLMPRERPASSRRILWWQLFPVAFLAATWVRGGITSWYPYAFLDPTASSWSQVLITTVVVLAAFFAIATLMHLACGRLQKTPAAQIPSVHPAR